MTTIKKTIAEWLRCLADRLDYDGAPKVTGFSFTFEDHQGLVFRDDGRGCPIAYLGERDYRRAHDEAGAYDPRAYPRGHPYGVKR